MRRHNEKVSKLEFTCPYCGGHRLVIEDIIWTDIDELWRYRNGDVDYYEGNQSDPIDSRNLCGKCRREFDSSLEVMLREGTLKEKENVDDTE